MTADQPHRTNIMAHPVAERLDTLMVVLMAYIRDVCNVDGTDTHTHTIHEKGDRGGCVSAHP